MAGRVAGRIALVTGAASGIGRATALLLAREGALVVATDVSPGEALLAELAAHGPDHMFLPLDVTDEAAWADVVARVAERHGRLDILVNNAGIAHARPVDMMELALWRRIMAVNVDGVFLGVKHGLPLMRAGGGGSIVNMSSIAGIKPSPGASAYAASKAAVRQFTKAVALECAVRADGVRVNSLHPGLVETAIWETLGTRGDAGEVPRRPSTDPAMAASIPLGRVGTAEEVAEGVLWLAGEESRYVTGIELVIDGGRSIA